MNYPCSANITSVYPRSAGDCVDHELGAPSIGPVLALILYFAVAIVAPYLVLSLMAAFLAITWPRTPVVLLFLSRDMPRRAAKIFIKFARILRIAKRKATKERRLFT